MESNTEPLTTITFDPFDEAIIKALRKYPQGIRNTKLNNESKINGETINVKTFNQHLKRLANIGVVDRKEEGRAKVFYKLHPTKIQESARKGRELGIKYLVVEKLVSLYEHRKEINEHKAQEIFTEILSRGLTPTKNIFREAIYAGINNPIDLSLLINEATEFFRETVIGISGIIEQNDETRAFFYPLLKKTILP